MWTIGQRRVYKNREDVKEFHEQVAKDPLLDLFDDMLKDNLESEKKATHITYLKAKLKRLEDPEFNQKYKERQVAYREKNRDKFRAYQKKYYNDRYHNDPAFRKSVKGYTKKYYNKKKIEKELIEDGL